MNQSKGKARPNTSNRNRVNTNAVSRGESLFLTGGTNDVSPQTMSFIVTQSGADASTTGSQPLPIEKFGSVSSNRARIIEVLKVWFYINVTGNNAEVDSYVTAFLTTSSFGTTATTHANPKIIASVSNTHMLTTSGTFLEEQPKCVDLTDGNGHGVLVGTDNVYLQVNSGTTSTANSVTVRILYRFKAVGLPEYIGIVQSQQ